MISPTPEQRGAIRSEECRGSELGEGRKISYMPISLRTRQGL